MTLDSASIPPMHARLVRLRDSGWDTDPEERHLTKSFGFRNWTRCLNFAQLVEIYSWSNDHHALLKLANHRGDTFAVTVRWVTYKGQPARVTDRDIESAEHTDTCAVLAKAFPKVSADSDDSIPVHHDKVPQPLPDGWLHRGSTVSKKFHLRTYTKCRDFVHLLGVESKARNYHPEIIYFPCWVHIKWPLLPSKNVAVVLEYCDTVAAKLGDDGDQNEGSHAYVENL
ncbi:hypothetical protein BST61_g2128 [Cercospora zeina]